MMRVAANLSWLFKECGATVAARCQAARAAGFRYVESDWPSDSADDYKKALQEAGLEPVLLNCYHGEPGVFGFASLSGGEKKFLESLEMSLQMANVIGCKRLHILSGLIEKDILHETQENTLVSNLRLAVPLLQQHGIVALIEPINPVSVPGYFLNDFEKGLRVVKAVDSPLLRLQLDFFHLQMVTSDALANMKSLLPYIGHVQVAQIPSRHEPHTTGNLDYEQVFNVLKEYGYSGYIGCEYKPLTLAEEGLGWVKQYGLEF